MNSYFHRAASVIFLLLTILDAFTQNGPHSLVDSQRTVNSAAPGYSVVYSFPGGTQGAFPFGAVTRDHKGNIYGSTYKTDGADGGTGFGVIYAVSATGQETVIQTFQGPPYEGANPKGGTIHYEGMYSTTTSGGSSTNCGGGCGVVWTHRFKGPGQFAQVLHDFTAGNDGANPVGDLARDPSFTLYGVTTYGGNSLCGGYGCGIVYAVTPLGVETVMHRFSGADGQFPRAGLVLSGNTLYGTTSSGGSGDAGTVFKIDLAGNFTTLYEFKGRNDGSQPEGSVVVDAAGNIYGTTLAGGGGADCPGGCGTVFKLHPGGQETVLHAFSGGDDGADPRGILAMDSKERYLYGVTSIGGKGKPGSGVIYSIRTSDGFEKVIHTFQGGSDGENPFGGLIMNVFGDLFGTTVYGGDMSCGSRGCGLVFTVSWTEE